MKKTVLLNRFKKFSCLEVSLDGLTFNSESIQAERIAEDADYEGIRICFQGSLGSAKVKMQIDIGFSDVIFPFPQDSSLD